MFKNLLFVALFVLAVQGRPENVREEIRKRLSGWINPFIWGGQDANKGEFPHMVQLQYGGSHMCGASVIAENYIVTAAHCVTGSTDGITAVAGQHKLSADDGTEQESEFKTVNIHPKYGSEGYDFDIAVVELKTPFTFNDAVQPIALWEEKETPFEPAFVSGWGDDEDWQTPDTLQKLDLTIYEKQVCKDAYGGDSFTDNMLCATGNIDGGQCVCFGDSGSPMFIEQGGTKYQVGIVSWGNPCANAGYPAAYAEVGKFIDFVHEVVPGL